MVFKKDLWKMMEEMNKNMEKLTREFWEKSKESGFEFKQRPSMDVMDEGSEVIIKMDMPGTRKEDINVRATEDMLEVSAERKEIEKEEEKDFYRRERRYTGYQRSFSLPEGSKPDEIEAEYEEGVLTITVPKKEGKGKKKKKIQVK